MCPTPVTVCCNASCCIKQLLEIDMSPAVVITFGQFTPSQALMQRAVPVCLAASVASCIAYTSNTLLSRDAFTQRYQLHVAALGRSRTGQSFQRASLLGVPFTTTSPILSSSVSIQTGGAGCTAIQLECIIQAAVCQQSTCPGRRMSICTRFLF